MLWLLDGSIVADENGVPIDCSHCPCQVCGQLIQTGSYHIVLSVSGYRQDTGFHDWEPGEFVTREEWETTVSCSATLQGTLPADGFIKSNTNRWLSVQTGSTVSGSYFDAFTMIYQGGSDTNWTLIQGNRLATMTEYDVPRGNGWLIIHCNNDTNNQPIMQVLFSDLTNCVYSDNWTSDQPYSDIYVFPNNYYTNSYFDNHTVTLQKYRNGYIVTGATLSKNVDQTLPNGNRHIQHNLVTATLTYIPPAN